MNRQHAFTLVELMVTLAVLGISLMIAVPSFLSITRTNRTASETNALVGALSYARSEAVKRGGGAAGSDTVSVCTSNNGTACSTGIGWGTGWIVFRNANNTAPAQVAAATDILRVYGAITPGNTISPSAALADYITFDSSGFSNKQGEFVLCDSSGVTSARAVSVTRIGRVSLTTGGGTCIAP